MSAEDELALPRVPEAKPDDPEDVSWSLSTAEAMWARGDHREGIKWVRKAAEAASEVERDERALELAKAAAELTTVLSRRSRGSFRDVTALESGGHTEATLATTSEQPVPAMPTRARPQPPRASSPPQAPSSRTSSPPAVASSRPSAPPAAASSRPSAPPVLPSKGSQPAGAPPPALGRAPQRPVAASNPQGPAAGRGILSNRTPADRPSKPRRRSRENLDKEAEAAGVLSAPHLAADGDATLRTLRGPDKAPAAEPSAPARHRRRSRPDLEPPSSDVTIVAGPEHFQHASETRAGQPNEAQAPHLAHADADHVSGDGDRKTINFPIAVGSAAAQAPVRPPEPAPARASLPVHDPAIQTSQAVRVVVWRDANGVHIAPAGTVVSAIKIDAVLVALDDGADLTAWLSQRVR